MRLKIEKRLFLQKLTSCKCRSCICACMIYDLNYQLTHCCSDKYLITIPYQQWLLHVLVRHTYTHSTGAVYCDGVVYQPIYSQYKQIIHTVWHHTTSSYFKPVSQIWMGNYGCLLNWFWMCMYFFFDIDIQCCRTLSCQWYLTLKIHCKFPTISWPGKAFQPECLLAIHKACEGFALQDPPGLDTVPIAFWISSSLAASRLAIACVFLGPCCLSCWMLRFVSYICFDN